MPAAADTPRRRLHPAAQHFTTFIHAASANLSSLLTPKPPSPPLSLPRIHLRPILTDRVLSLTSPSESAQPDSLSTTDSGNSSSSGSPSPSANGFPPTEPGSRLPSTVQLTTTGKGGGPAFVGQVFSMCDLSGTGLMAVSTHFDIPFLSKRTPEWLKKIFAAVTKSERNGPVFRFFMDLGDAVSYVKQLNIPSGVVGACRLDIAYEHFKEKPDLFQFIPNEKQVKEANKLLKNLPHSNVKKKVQGVPVFSAQNLDIAIASKDGIKWYTPYFFDKNMLDNILEDSVDQHFQSLIETRHFQRRRDVVDDSLSAEAVEEMGENMLDPPELQEMLEEIGHPGIPLSVIAKAAEIQLMYAVDKVLLGNRWLRRATGIQPKFPYMVDSFEKKSEASFLRTKTPPRLLSSSEFDSPDTLKATETKDISALHHEQQQVPNFQFPFGDWFRHPWMSKHQENQQNTPDTRNANSIDQHQKQELHASPFLPKVTMVGISTGEPRKMSKAALKQTMDDLTKELEKAEQLDQAGIIDTASIAEDRDPLFVANVGDYPGVSKTSSTRWVRGSY